MSVFSWLTQKLNGVESVVDSHKIKYSDDMTDTASVKDKIDALKSDLNNISTVETLATRCQIIRMGTIRIVTLNMSTYSDFNAITLSASDTPSITMRNVCRVITSSYSDRGMGEASVTYAGKIAAVVGAATVNSSDMVTGAIIYSV